MDSMFARYNEVDSLDRLCLIWEANDQREIVSEMILANDIESMKRLLTHRFVYNDEMRKGKFTVQPTMYQCALLFALELGSIGYNGYECLEGFKELANGSPLILMLAARYLIERFADLSAEVFVEDVDITDFVVWIERDVENDLRLGASSIMRLDHSAKSADLFMQILGPASDAKLRHLSSKTVGERLASSAKQWSKRLHHLCNEDR